MGNGDSLSFNKVIGIALALIALATVGATAIGMIETYNTTGWGTATIAMWGVVGIFGLIAVIRWLVGR